MLKLIKLGVFVFVFVSCVMYLYLMKKYVFEPNPGSEPRPSITFDNFPRIVHPKSNRISSESVYIMVQQFQLVPG